MRALRLGLYAVSAVATVAVAWWLAPAPSVAPITLSKDTTYISEPLREDGTPDYALWMNRKHGAGVTADNNAATALAETQPTDPAGDAKDLAEQKKRALRGPWSATDAPLVAAWLEANHVALTRVEEIAKTRSRHFVPMPGDYAMDTAVETRLRYRTMADALRARALLSLGRGDRQGAVRDLGTLLRLASLVDQGWFLVDHLVAAALLETAAEAAVVLATHADGRAAGGVLQELQRLPVRPALEEALEDERVSTLAVYVDMYRAARGSPGLWKARADAVAKTLNQMAAGLGIDWRSSWDRVPPWAIDWDELLRTVNRCHMRPGCDAEIRLAQGDLHSATRLRLVALARFDRSARKRLATALFSDERFLGEPESDGPLRHSWSQNEALLQVVRVSVAAAAHKLESGRYPASPTVRGQATRSGYTFRYVADDRSFAYSAAPAVWSSTGQSFCADSTGRLAQTLNGFPIEVVGGVCDPAARTRVGR